MHMSAQNAAQTRQAGRPAPMLGLGHAGAPGYAHTSDCEPTGDSARGVRDLTSELGRNGGL